jgi:TPR repeat protein
MVCFYKRNICVFFFFICFLYFGGTKTMCLPKIEIGSPTTISSDVIPEKALEEKKIEAMNGDGKVADKIARHFIFGKNNYSESLYWLGIGAENGHLESCYGLVILLSHNQEYDLRSVFWLYKMAAVNYRGALSQIERLGLSLMDAQPPDDGLFSFSTPSEVFSYEEIIRYKEGALRGNGKAALVLANYYREVLLSIATAEYWYRIGAQNGDLECQYQLSRSLESSSAELDNIRSLFWLKKAAQNGHYQAKKELEMINYVRLP